jgi:hypothetical protein
MPQPQTIFIPRPSVAILRDEEFNRLFIVRMLGRGVFYAGEGEWCSDRSRATRLTIQDAGSICRTVQSELVAEEA